MGDSHMSLELLRNQKQQENQNIIKAQYADAASDMTKWGQTGTPKRYKRKTDWFGLISAAVVILIVILILVLK